MKKIFAFIIGFGAVSFMYAQESKPIDIEIGYWSGSSFYIDDYEYEESEIKELLKTDQEIFDHYNSGKSLQQTGKLSSAFGVGVLGYTVIASIRGNSPNKIIGIIGLVMMGNGFPLYYKGEKRVKEAIDWYNEDLEATSFFRRSEGWKISLENTVNGFGIVFSF